MRTPHYVMLCTLVTAISLLGSTARADQYQKGVVTWRVAGEHALRKTPVSLRIRTIDFGKDRECEINVSMDSISMHRGPTVMHNDAEVRTAGLPSADRLKGTVVLTGSRKERPKDGFLRWGWRDGFHRFGYELQNIGQESRGKSQDIKLPAHLDKEFSRLEATLNRLSSQKGGPDGALLTATQTREIVKALTLGTLNATVNQASYPESANYAGKGCEVKGIKFGE